MNFAQWLKDLLFPPKQNKPRRYRLYEVISLSSGQTVGACTNYVDACRLLRIVSTVKGRRYVLVHNRGVNLSRRDAVRLDATVSQLNEQERELRRLKLNQRN